MSLQKLRQRLSIDQRNLLFGEVVQDGTRTVRVRTSAGEIRDAIKQEGASYQVGQLLELRVAGRAVQVQGPAPLAQPGGEVVYLV